MDSEFLSDVGFLNNNTFTAVTILCLGTRCNIFLVHPTATYLFIHNVTKVGITDMLLYVFDRTSCATALTLNWMLLLATDLILIPLRK